MTSNRVSHSKMYAILLAIITAQVKISLAFLPTNAGRIRSTNVIDDHRHLREISTTNDRYAAAANDSVNEDSEDTTEERLVALPPIGTSSFWDRPTQDENPNNSSSNDSNSKKNNDIIISAEHTNLVSPKFQIQYTCKKCGHRNSHMVTRLAYRQGVVIAECKGCMTKHWIADNLGWSNHVGGFDYDNGERNIEMFMENKRSEAKVGTDCDDGGNHEKENDLVRRVNQDVFDLENILYKGQADDNALSTKGARKNERDEDEKCWS
mmetsp:Transcript_693/g.1174  ORF Transcript_693/g.1174 Transcript_693/m.1174 type:complete len:265 (-) Transcript_693:23-817(-)|eukprot:CAMPEP_0201615176 /NCGR_PEP_ID=MMETSP0492-20130828/30646_1 /ASSEMBLY_ACC=CAM_ASM_000837 /TAXON_ID=420259 /ORGANISM="Thalassiosira gravida, Strain GMp14c1" /LENGTH=264 /DNA_ID=CAMNT_0048082737 /DNA_START=1 /DNA_END=795 /DNA_ORIENTATION=-